MPHTTCTHHIDVHTKMIRIRNAAPFLYIAMVKGAPIHMTFKLCKLQEAGPDIRDNGAHMTETMVSAHTHCDGEDVCLHAALTFFCNQTSREWSLLQTTRAPTRTVSKGKDMCLHVAHTFFYNTLQDAGPGFFFCVRLATRRA